jgi:Dual specificity phosphatase, catalytic domain
MSFLEQLQRKKRELAKTETVVTTVDGRKYVCDGDERRIMDQISLGFVVDTSPDEIPACIIDNRLFLGSQDSVTEAVRVEFGITHILSVGIPAPQRLDHVVNRFIECLDLPETEFLAVLDQAIAFIDAGDKVLVHCNAGVSRSSSVVIGFLILRMGMTYDEAYGRVKAKRPCIQPNAGFVAQLKQLSLVSHHNLN